VPTLTAGCGPFETVTASEHIAAIRTAIDLGMNYFDTAPYYGNGESQQVLGRALKEISEPVFVATKVGHLPERSQHRDPNAILAQIHDNLRSLGRDHVDLLQVHEADWRGWWTDDEPLGMPVGLDESLDYADAPVMQALRQARDQGLCRLIGITGNTSDHLTHVLEHVEVDAVLEAYNYNLLCRGALKHTIPVARRQGIACIIAGPLYNGRLAAVHREWIHDPPGWMSPSLCEPYEQLCDLQEESGIPMPELAIRYLIGDPGITTLLTASTTVAEVRQNVAAATAGPLPHEIQQRLSDIGLEDPGTHPWLCDFWEQM
jgi:aryl-alcohol dehydrogenase-like predicted oxidoreductase